MKIKRLFSLMLVLMLAVCMIPAHADEEITPLLWKVTDDQGHVLYLFGTIHVGSADVYPLPDAVMSAFESCDALALELDVTTLEEKMMMSPEYLESMFLPDGDALSNHLSAEVLEDAYALLADSGYSPDMLEIMTPSTVYSLLDSVLLEQCVLESDYGVDMHLAQLAQDRNMPILEADSFELQMELLTGQPDALYELLIRSMVATADSYGTTIAALFVTWKQGNETMLNYFCVSDYDGMEEDEIALLEAYDDLMQRERNVGMTDFAEAQLLSGDQVFMAVGVAHMMGEHSLVAMLTERGYTVEKVEY